MDEGFSWYKELKSWQAGIAALLGFGGLMAAALWNFRLNRRRDAALRKEESLAVAGALYGEIVLLRTEVALLARVVSSWHLEGRELKVENLNDYKPREPTIFPALADKIGLLTPSLVVPIIKFYSDLELTKHGLPLVVEDPCRDYTHSILTLLEPAQEAVSATGPLLRQIEHLLRLPKADEPDTGDTAHVIGMERDMLRATAE